MMREFTVTDSDKCADLYRKVFTDYPWYDEWISFDQVRYYLEELNLNPAFEGFVAFEGPDMVAACLGHSRSWWMGKEFFIDEFYVENERQGNGVGTALMDYVEEELMKKDYRRLILTTDREIPAENFYKRKGFNNKENRTVMTKEICGNQNLDTKSNQS